MIYSSPSFNSLAATSEEEDSRKGKLLWVAVRDVALLMGWCPSYQRIHNVLIIITYFMNKIRYVLWEAHMDRQQVLSFLLTFLTARDTTRITVGYIFCRSLRLIASLRLRVNSIIYCKIICHIINLAYYF